MTDYKSFFVIVAVCFLNRSMDRKYLIGRRMKTQSRTLETEMVSSSEER